MKWIAYLGSIILGTYLAFVVLRSSAPAAATCSMPAWHLVFPPVEGGWNNDDVNGVAVFDLQAPTNQWNKAVDYFPTIGECQRNFLKQSASDELEWSAKFPHTKEFEQQLRATGQCVCFNDPRFS